MLTKNSDGRWIESIRSDLGGGAGNPGAEVIVDSEGNIFGTGTGGGKFECGTVFEVPAKSGREKPPKILFNFPNQNVCIPAGQLWRDPAGNLYGTAEGGPFSYSGAVYELSHNHDGSWTENTLHIFGQPGDGNQPLSGLAHDSKGNLYGIASAGGQYGVGAVYELARGSDGTWTYSIVYEFGTKPNDGNGPVGGPTMGPGDVLYGTTYSDGVHGKARGGKVFEIKLNDQP
jgi:hypothetical protein